LKVQGVHESAGEVETVWARLTDPEVLVHCIPGCEKLERVEGNRFKASLRIGIASIKGNYGGSIEMIDVDPPRSFGIRIDGKGAPGFVRGEVTLALAGGGGTTEIRYDGDIQVGGLIASVGQRILGGVATTLVRQFFDAFDRKSLL